MTILSAIWNEGFYRPIFNFLVFLYNTIPGHDIGVAIIILTIVLRMIMWPLSQKSIKSQKAMQDLQPQLKAIQNKHKDNKEKQAQEVMTFYKQNKINPLGSCLPMLIQLPFLIALYQVLRDAMGSAHLDALYPFIHNPGTINSSFLGILDLSKPDRFVLPILAGVLQFIQSKMLMRSKPKNENQKQNPLERVMSSQMVYFMPLITVFFAMTLPAGLPLYWVVTTLMAILQQWLIMRKHNNSKSKEIIQNG